MTVPTGESDIRRGIQAEGVEIERRGIECACAEPESHEPRGLARMTASLSARFLSVRPAGFDDLIRTTLSEIGQTTGADGVYLYEFSNDGIAVRKAHLWSSGCGVPIIDESGEANSQLPFSLTRLRWYDAREELPEGVPSDIRREHEALRRGRVRSLINVPLFAVGNLVGAIGLISSRDGLGFTEELVAHLRTLGHVLAAALDRIRQERDFRDEKRRFLRLVAGLDEAMYRVWLPEVRYEYFGPGTGRVFGRSAAELRENPSLMEEIVVPPGEELSDLLSSPDMKREPARTREYRVTDPRGGERWVLQSYNVVRDEAGKPVLLEGICRDVTRQKEIERQLRSSEERFRVITENSSDVIVVLDEHGVFTYVASSLHGVLDRNPEELVGRSLEEILHPDDLPAAREAFNNSLARPGETLRVPDVRVQHHDGHWVWFDGLVSNLIDHPAVRGLVVNSRDISARKQTEEALIAAHENLESKIAERTRALAEVNERLSVERASLKNRTVALREVLDQIEDGKKEQATRIQTNVTKIALPILDILERSGTQLEGHYLRLLRSCLEDITAPLAYVLDKKFPELTPREQEICQMVASGMSCKEIASTLNVSDQTILKQRKSIRRKLGLRGKMINLSSFLRSLG